MTKRAEHVVVDSPAVGPRKRRSKPPWTARSGRITVGEAVRISGLSEWAILSCIASDVPTSERLAGQITMAAREDAALVRDRDQLVLDEEIARSSSGSAWRFP